MIENYMEYDPAPFKRTKSRLSMSELTTISIQELVKDTGFRFRAANSPIFFISEIKMCDIVEMYSNVSAGYWMPAVVYKIPYRRARAWPSASREQRYLAYNAGSYFGSRPSPSL